MGTIITPREGEKVYFTIRKNLVRLVKPIFKFALLFFISILAIIFSPNDIITLVAAVVLLFSVSYAFYYFLLWFYDVYIITNKRVIAVQQKGLFSKEFAEIELDKIKDVSYSIKGVFATLFRFGNVKIKGEDIDLELESLSDPDEAQEMLKKLSQNAKAKNPKNDFSASELVEYIMKNHKK
jgi:uncharacterized membrane protein YdbT with pleckstrin-like domain